MRCQVAVFSLLLCTSACSRSTPEGSAPLFGARVDQGPLLVKLRQSGGDPSRVLHPHAASDLLQLQSGARYKFVVRRDGQLAIAPRPVDSAGNEYVHPILGEGAAVRTAGGIRVEHDDKAVTAVVLDQDSKAYCPTLASLQAAQGSLSALGVMPSAVRMEDRPPKCEQPR